MRLSTSFAFCSLVAASLSSLACSGSDAGAEGLSTVREVTGALKPGENITQVVAVQSRADAQSAKSFTAVVDATGHFTLSLPVGDRYIVLFMSGDKATGVLRFKDGQTGAFTSILPVTHAPGATEGLKPQAKSEDGAEDEAEDEGEDDIELGDVDNPAGDDQYEPSNNPEEQVDSDDDGSNDYEDSDDDNDGQEDAEDVDDDNDGDEDESEDLDEDDDGSPDQVDPDDDNDGTPDDDEPGTDDGV